MVLEDAVALQAERGKPRQHASAAQRADDHATDADHCDECRFMHRRIVWA